MNVNSKRLKIYILIMLAVGLVSSSLRTVACLYDLDISLGHFGNDALINTSGVILWIGIILLLGYILISAGVNLRPSFTSPLSYIPTGIISVALLFVGVRILSSCDFAEIKKAISELSRTADAQNIPSAILNLLGVCLPVFLAFLIVCSIAHLFLSGYFTSEHSVIRGYFALATVLFLAIYVAYLHMREGIQINAPNKITDQMAYLFCALFFLFEARISLGRQRWNLYAAVGLAAAALCLYSAIPSLITYFVKGELISASLEENLLTLSLFVFITSRLAVVAILPENKETAGITALRTAAEERRREIKSDETQENIDDQLVFDLPTFDVGFDPDAEHSEEEVLAHLAEQMADPDEYQEELLPSTEPTEADSTTSEVEEDGKGEEDRAEQPDLDYDIFEEVTPSRLESTGILNYKSENEEQE